MKLPHPTTAPLPVPRYVELPDLNLVGLSMRHGFGNAQGIPLQWQAFMGRLNDIAARRPAIPVGVYLNVDEDGTFEHVCAAEVTRPSKPPSGLIALNIPAHRYAVFQHLDHASTLGATYAAIWDQWLEMEKRIASNAPSLERCMESFDPRTGLGGVEIWIPVEASPS